ncbi:hypothetical protein IJJ53_03585 [Candidatus Saccharibacteria bacterium]|nr:hypothetical protein [Candidatus Saccharibacteria bacterium]
MNNQKTLADRHPKLNLVLGFMLLLILLYTVYIIIKIIFHKIAEVFTWIGNFASNHDAVITVALITGTVSIVTVLISTIIGKIIEYNFEKRKYLSMKREKPYEDFIGMVYKINDNIRNPGSYTNEKMVKDVMGFSEELTLWGSSRVANKWVKFRQDGVNTKNATDNLFVLEEIMNEMRKDLGSRKVKKGNLLAFFVNNIKNNTN